MLRTRHNKRRQCVRVHPELGLGHARERGLEVRQRFEGVLVDQMGGRRSYQPRDNRAPRASLNSEPANLSAPQARMMRTASACLPYTISKCHWQMSMLRSDC